LLGVSNHSRFDEGRFLSTLRRLVALGPHLQNAPAIGLVPAEALAADIVEEVLRPGVESGFVEIDRIVGPHEEARPSLVITVAGEGPGHLGLVGAHFDVVVADRQRDGWERDPFELVLEEGVLYGRGTTDCLGHVALLTELLRALAADRRRPRRTLTVVMIANEESSPIAGLGMEAVVASGRLDVLRGAPLIWLDSADFGPTVGTGGVVRWRLETKGVPGHSGMTHNCVNALELAMAATLWLREQFEQCAPAHPEEARYGFPTPSTFKPTLIEVPNRGISNIPGSARVQGDFRLTPFHDMARTQAAVVSAAQQLSSRVARDDAPDGFPRVRTVDGRRGSVDFQWVGGATEGLACDLESSALHALEAAIRRVRGAVHRSSMTGALPLVRDLQRQGFDVQVTGFGRSEFYHAPNEQARLADFRDGFEVLWELVCNY
jgi:acetylornithine deacetylase